MTIEPGIIGGEVNRFLAEHKVRGNHPIQYKIGPDPSSIASCMVGGMVNNNSSGMCCGVSQNTYHTVKDMRVVFLDGTVLDTANQNSRDAFQKVLHSSLPNHECLLSKQWLPTHVLDAQRITDLMRSCRLAAGMQQAKHDAQSSDSFIQPAASPLYAFVKMGVLTLLCALHPCSHMDSCWMACQHWRSEFSQTQAWWPSSGGSLPSSARQGTP